MNRRHFLKCSGAFTVASAAPGLFGLPGMVGTSQAAQLETADFLLPQRLPQIINVFLYGGASELAGNLTNIEHINSVSQNTYPRELLRSVQEEGGQITANGFWRDAGGLAIEEMLASGDMSVYRTINRRKNNTRAHRQSIHSSQKGSLSIDIAPGMGSTIAAVLLANREQLDGSEQLGGKTLEELVLPFVSFEGSSVAFAPDPDGGLPLRMRGLSLHENFENPYSRSDSSSDAELNALIDKMIDANYRARFGAVIGGFEQRTRMEQLIGDLQAAADSPLPSSPNAVTGEPDTDIDPDTGYLRYPDDNRFSARIKAAVTLAIHNPDSRFISLGGGLGSWDDHDGAINEYVPRMAQLMTALRVAAKHIRYSDISNGGFRDTSNIIINVHGDFGRNVNLNNSSGWDHGNNQNLYTIGGQGIRSQHALGKVVGRTEVFGSAAQNRLFTKPVDGSYETEPMAIAASTYRYFGVNNPKALTHDPVHNPDGDDSIDETTAGEPLA